MLHPIRQPKKEGWEFLFLFLALIAVLLTGTFGYKLIEGWSYLDSLFMTVITLSTVGFSEIHPLSAEGRVFTIVLIFIGVGVAMVGLTSLASKVLAQQVLWIYERRNMQKRIEKMNGHTVVCGYGRISEIVCEKLANAGIELVVIDSNEDKLQLAGAKGIMTIKGDATEEVILEQAGVERAGQLVSLLPKDADNLYVVLTSREKNREMLISTRAELPSGERRLAQAGANRIISPYHIGGQKIADGLLRPHVTAFLDLAASSDRGDLQIEEIRVPEGSPLKDRSIQESGIRDSTNVIIAAVISPSGETQLNPAANTLITPGSTLIGLGNKEDLKRLESRLLGEEVN